MEPFRKVKVTIFVRKEAWISIVDLIIPAGISPTRVAFVPFFSLDFRYFMKRTLISCIKCFPNFRNNLTVKAFQYYIQTVWDIRTRFAVSF